MAKAWEDAGLPRWRLWLIGAALAFVILFLALGAYGAALILLVGVAVPVFHYLRPGNLSVSGLGVAFGRIPSKMRVVRWRAVKEFLLSRPYAQPLGYPYQVTLLEKGSSGSVPIVGKTHNIMLVDRDGFVRQLSRFGFKEGEKPAPGVRRFVRK